MLTIRTLDLNNPQAALRNFLLAAAATLSLIIASLAPTSADAGQYHFGSADDLLDDLIEMDAGEIKSLQSDLEEARADIREAISDIAEAREEVKDAPVGGAIVNVAFKVAQVAVDRATGVAINKARATLDDAEALLGARRAEIGDDEFFETSGAIDMVRSELIELEYALEALAKAFREA